MTAALQCPAPASCRLRARTHATARLPTPNPPAAAQALAEIDVKKQELAAARVVRQHNEEYEVGGSGALGHEGRSRRASGVRQSGGARHA
jgi:hypothetical protein